MSPGASPSVNNLTWTVPAAAILLMACQAQSVGGERLPALGTAGQKVTVSGISSGGYMAGQFHVAHSTLVDGVGLLAAGPYDCAQGSIQKALGPCVKGGIEIAPLVEAARAAAARNAIDPLESLKGDRAWLFHGSADVTVAAGVVASARETYAALAPDMDMVTIDNVPVAHGMPTKETGGECGKMGRPYLNSCGYSAAGAMLRMLRGELAAPREATGRLIEFDQAEFGEAHLNGTGFVYVPAACKKGRACGVHVFFHGCDQSAEVVGNAVVTGAGFNEWAEANGIVVLYPQAKASKLAPMNPLGCWDWWGYSGENYATREGVQIKAVKAMLDRLATKP